METGRLYHRSVNQVSPRRVHVVGTSGAGKTTYARALAAACGLPHRELDEVFWGPQWTRKDPDVARAILRDFLDGDGAQGWVVDGNWTESAAGLLDDAELLVWLDYSRPVVMSRVIRRTVSRVVTRQELWHGNREDWRCVFHRNPADNVVLWAWHSYRPNRERNLARMAAGEPPAVRLRTPRAARRWLRQFDAA